MAETLTPRCSVRGHDHHTLVVKEYPGRGYLLECPSGMYRWLHPTTLDQPLRELIRMKRPRWGWKIERRVPLFKGDH